MPNIKNTASLSLPRSAGQLLFIHRDVARPSSGGERRRIALPRNVRAGCKYRRCIIFRKRSSPRESGARRIPDDQPVNERAEELGSATPFRLRSCAFSIHARARGIEVGHPLICPDLLSWEKERDLLTYEKDREREKERIYDDAREREGVVSEDSRTTLRSDVHLV